MVLGNTTFVTFEIHIAYHLSSMYCNQCHLPLAIAGQMSFDPGWEITINIYFHKLRYQKIKTSSQNYQNLQSHHGQVHRGPEDRARH